MRSLTLAALTAAALAANVARADIIDNIVMNYASGATFDGTLTLTNDFTAVVSLAGTLTGYDPFLGFVGGGVTDPISTLPTPPFNYAPLDGLAPNIFFTTVVDAGFNFLDFAYSYSPSGIAVDPALSLNDIDYTDPLVSSMVTPVGEPGTLALLGVGLLGLAVTRRRWTVRASLR